MRKTLQFVATCAVACAIASTVPVRGQVGAGLLDPNVAPEAQVSALPHMTPAIVKELMAKRPFGNVVELNTMLTGQGLTAAQTAEIYAKAFIHVNLNTGTREEILLIPRRATAWRASSPRTARGSPGRNSTRKSVSTSRSPRSIT